MHSPSTRNPLSVKLDDFNPNLSEDLVLTPEQRKVYLLARNYFGTTSQRQHLQSDDVYNSEIRSPYYISNENSPPVSSSIWSTASVGGSFASASLESADSTPATTPFLDMSGIEPSMSETECYSTVNPETSPDPSPIAIDRALRYARASIIAGRPVYFSESYHTFGSIVNSQSAVKTEKSPTLTNPFQNPPEIIIENEETRAPQSEEEENPLHVTNEEENDSYSPMERLKAVNCKNLHGQCSRSDNENETCHCSCKGCQFSHCVRFENKEEDFDRKSTFSTSTYSSVEKAEVRPKSKSGTITSIISLTLETPKSGGINDIDRITPFKSIIHQHKKDDVLNNNNNNVDVDIRSISSVPESSAPCYESIQSNSTNECLITKKETIEDNSLPKIESLALCEHGNIENKAKECDKQCGNVNDLLSPKTHSYNGHDINLIDAISSPRHSTYKSNETHDPNSLSPSDTSVTSVSIDSSGIKSELSPKKNRVFGRNEKANKQVEQGESKDEDDNGSLDDENCEEFYGSTSGSASGSSNSTHEDIKRGPRRKLSMKDKLKKYYHSAQLSRRLSRESRKSSIIHHTQ